MTRAREALGTDADLSTAMGEYLRFPQAYAELKRKDVLNGTRSALVSRSPEDVLFGTSLVRRFWYFA